MATRKKLSLSDRFGIMKPSKTAMEEDTCEAADRFRDEYIKIITTRQPSTDCVKPSLLISSDDEELDFEMEDSWKEHFETCLKGNTLSEREHRNSVTNDSGNISKAFKMARAEFKEQHRCWKENYCQNKPLDQIKAVEKVGISFKAKKPEEIERSDIIATDVSETIEGKNQNKGKTQEYCKISKSKTSVVEGTKQVKNGKDETLVSFSSQPQQKRSDEKSDENYVSPLDNIYETKLAEKSSIYNQKEKPICDDRTRFNNAQLKQLRLYPCQNDGSINLKNIKRNSSVNRNSFEQERSQTVSPFCNTLMSDSNNYQGESLPKTQNSSHNLMEKDQGFFNSLPSSFSSSEVTTYNSTQSHSCTSYSQNNVSELELLEKTLNVPSGFYARKICKNTYKPPEKSKSEEHTFMSMTPGFYREMDNSDYREKSFESSPEKELFQTLLQQCSDLVHTMEDQKALEAVISLISQQASGNLDMNKDVKINNVVTTMMDKVQQSEKDMVTESCHSTTKDDFTEIGLIPGEALSSSCNKVELFEGRTLLKGGVKPRHIPKTYIPKPNREPPFDPRRFDIDKKIIICLPLPKFFAESFKLKMAEKLNVSFKAKNSEFLEISDSPMNEEDSFSDYIVHDDRRISCKSLGKDTPAVLGTSVKAERCNKDLLNQTNRIYGKLNFHKDGSTSVPNKSSEMETSPNINDTVDYEYEDMLQRLCHTRSELMNKTRTNSIIWQEKYVSEGRNKISALNSKNEIDYAMESVSELVTSLRDPITSGLEQAKVKEVKKLHIKKDNPHVMASTLITETLKENSHSTDDQILKSDKKMSNINENKPFLENFEQMPTFNKECQKTIETSVVEVVKTLQTPIHFSQTEHMEHAMVTNASSETLRASRSSVHEFEKTTNLNITDTHMERKPLFTFKLKKSLGHSNEKSSSTQVQCDTIAVPTNEALGSTDASNIKEETIKDKLNSEVQTSIGLSQEQQYCYQSDFHKCKMYDPCSPTETIVEEVSMELDSSMEEGETQPLPTLDMNISSNAAKKDEKEIKDLGIVRTKWKERFYTTERQKEWKSTSNEFVFRKTLLESVTNDIDDFGESINGYEKSCGSNISQEAKVLRLSNHSCCDRCDAQSRARSSDYSCSDSHDSYSRARSSDHSCSDSHDSHSRARSSDYSCKDSHDSRSRGRCKTLQPIRKGLNDGEDCHRKSSLCRRPGSRNQSYSRAQDSLSHLRSEGSNHINDSHTRCHRSRSRSRSYYNCKDSDSRDRCHRSHSKRNYERDRDCFRHSSSKHEYFETCSWSRSHCCSSRSLRDYKRSSEKIRSDESCK